MPGEKALAECIHWAAVLACSAATGELPAVGLKLLNDLVHLLYCSRPTALQVRFADTAAPHLRLQLKARKPVMHMTQPCCGVTVHRVCSNVRRVYIRLRATPVCARLSAITCRRRLANLWKPSLLLCSLAG